MSRSPADDLPTGWCASTLGAVTDNYDGQRRPVKASDRADRTGEYPYYGASGVIDFVDQYIFDGTYLLVAEDGANLLSRSTPIAFTAKGRFWVNNHAHILQTKANCSLDYLQHYLNWLDVAPYVTGTAQPKLTQKALNRIPVPLPPIDEQQRIMARVNSLFERSKGARDELVRVPGLVERYKQTILASAFRGDLTSASRTSGSIPPPTWGKRALGEIADVGTGSTPKRGEPRFYMNGTIPWITSTAVNKAYIENATEMITEAALRETNCKLFPAGTIVMAMYGEGQTRGRVATLGIPAATNQALAAISILDSNVVLADFVLWFLRANYLELRSQAAGGVQPNLNLGIIKALQIPLPHIAEQYEIVRHIDEVCAHCDRISDEVTHAIDMLDRLDQASLAKAFRGELVPKSDAEQIHHEEVAAE